MAEKQRVKAQEKLEAAQELLAAEKAEEEYQQKMKAAMHQSCPQTDFRRKKIEWFS